VREESEMADGMVGSVAAVMEEIGPAVKARIHSAHVEKHGYGGFEAIGKIVEVIGKVAGVKISGVPEWEIEGWAKEEG
jgi:hypothetical protein